ncbi:MAG: ABC transporter permease [Candidatus Aminicenantes bacterium]|nr:MAG: ABC transporter permease [Candidatus Aminicenantes bacterium]HHF43505.1 ABC transporter permease [Candidatus Aminicenantes bacterium]
MSLLKLALRNLLGARLRTWLNVIVLSFAFVAIIGLQGVYEGMNRQAMQAEIDAEYGGGQFWHPEYNPYDPLTLQQAHGSPPEKLQAMIDNGLATPILILQGTAYPQGRFYPVLLKGIDPNQKILTMPSFVLKNHEAELPALIGERMADSLKLKVGDTVTLRWRDVNGTFDAREASIVHVMRTTVQAIDQGQIWLPLPRLQQLTGMNKEATLVVLDKDVKNIPENTGWVFKDQKTLLRDIQELVKTKTVGSSILYIILMLLAMLAIFDTQVLSIWRRRKEIGTLMALGMTRWSVVKLFTLEGALHGILATLVGAIYGLPLLTLFARKGWGMPEAVDSYGFAIGERIYPIYSGGLILGTALLVLIVTTLVSFLPTRRIAKMKPTEALRGRFQ